MSADAGSILAANLAALPPLTRRVIDSAGGSDVVQLHPGAQPSASLRTPDGRSVRIHSGRDPVAEADRFVESALGAVPGGAPSVVIVIGSGLGYIVEAIERRAGGTKVIAIEPFAALARAMLERRDWRTAIDGRRLTLLVGPQYLGAGDAGRLLDERAAASASTVEHPVVAREFPREMALARAAVDQLLRGATLNAQARKAFAGRYLLNTLRNVPAIAAEADVTALRGAFAGVPAIVVAAGPSLDNVLADLRALEERALIVAVDTTLRPLHAAGIRPHLVVAVDPSELNARHLLDLEDTDGSWLVSEGSIDPRVPPEFAGRMFGFKVSDHQPWPWLREHGLDRGTLRAWGSVLTTAFDMALYTGCDPVVFVGANLSYPDGLLYCRGTTNEVSIHHDAPTEVRVAGFAEAMREHKFQTCEEPDINGAPVMSTPQFVQFRDWLVSRAVEADDIRVLNATGAGILHGAAIEQVALVALSLPRLPESVEGVRGRLHALWTGSRAGHTAAQSGMARIFAERGAASLPLDAWHEFAADVSAGDILARLDAAWRTPPAVTVEPTDVLWLPGQAAVVRAAASGGPPPTVQWQASVDGGRSWSDVSGATGRRLALGIADLGKLFKAVFTNAVGSGATAPVRLTVAPRGVVADFDGDGKPDILWRDPATGDNYVWLMDGVARRERHDIEAVSDPAWLLVGSGDFSGRGRPELLWRWSLNGLTGIWPMLGVVDREPTLMMTAPPDPLWTIAGVGDFDGDGKSDIVWHHSRTGRLEVWCMDGMTPMRVQHIGDEPDLTWTIAAIGDFNDDGTPDILWRHSTSGRLRVWVMSGLMRTAVHALAEHVESSWSVVGTADFNGDGNTDILWHDAATGAAVVWYMDRTQRIAVDTLDTI